MGDYDLTQPSKKLSKRELQSHLDDIDSRLDALESVTKENTAVTISNTTTETTILSESLTLENDSIVRVRLSGHFFNGSGAAATIQWKVSLGGTNVYLDTGASLTNSGITNPWVMAFDVICMDHASNKRASGTLHIGDGAASTGDGDLASAALTSTAFGRSGVSISHASALTLLVTAKLSAADASLVFSRYGYTVSVI